MEPGQLSNVSLDVFDLALDAPQGGLVDSFDLGFDAREGRIVHGRK